MIEKVTVIVGKSLELLHAPHIFSSFHLISRKAPLKLLSTNDTMIYEVLRVFTDAYLKPLKHLRWSSISVILKWGYWKTYFFRNISEAYSEPSQTSKMAILSKIVNVLKSLTFFGKFSILDVWLGSKYKFTYLNQ